MQEGGASHALLSRDTVGVVGVAGTTARFLLVSIVLRVDLLVCGGVQTARGLLEGLATASHL